MLRPLASTDAKLLLRLYTDPSVRAFLGGPILEGEARLRVDTLLNEKRLHHTWAICSNDGTGFFGMVSLDAHHDGHDTQVSYLLLPEHQGYGHALRAVADALRRAFDILGLPRVVAETQAANWRSIQLLERIGMKFERRVKRFGTEQLVYAACP